MPELEETRTDEELVETVLAGHSELFGELYARFQRRAFRMAYGMVGDLDAAADLTQEIFMRAYQRLDQYQHRSAFSTWFYRLAVNTCLNYRARERKHKSEAADDAALLLVPGPRLPQSSIEAGVFQRQVQDQLRLALLSLKPELRIVIVLKEIEGLSYGEISERLGCPEGTVASRLNRARAILAQKLRHLQGAL